MSRTKNLIQILAACEKHEFDKVVKSYLKEIYEYERIVVTDGKDDTGIDIKVFDIAANKMQYQMTVQKSDTSGKAAQLKTKIFEDVAKAKENAEDYGYSNNLYFFYSYELTNKVQREYKSKALKEYNINLEIIDANQIAEESESYIRLQDTIYRTSGLEEFRLKKTSDDTKQQSLIYDMIGFGTTADVKLSIVESFIFSTLYDMTDLPIDEIVSKCIDKFNSKENPEFYNKLINRLYSTKHELSYDKREKKYSLSPEKRRKIELSVEQIKLDEQLFLKQMNDVLKTYKVEHELDDFIRILKQFYIDNFRNRIINPEEYNNIEANELKTYSEKRLETETEAKKLMIDLFKVCDSNSYLQQICASEIYSSKINVDALKNYADERKCVFVDTTIILYLLCRYSCDMRKDIQWSYYYNLSSNLFEFCKKNGVKLHLIERYMWEVNNHIQEAVNLVPFTNLENFKSLGKSKNVFYNFYSFLKDECGEKRSFSQYLSDFRFKNSTTQELNEYLELYLTEMGIVVDKLPKEYKIESISKIIETELSVKSKYKSKFALNNDSIMVEFLADKDCEVHLVDPVFITWDRILFGILPTFYRTKPNSQRWMQFTPSQFIDRYSLLSFSINETTITREMLAMLSGDIVAQTHSLLDSLSLILNPNNEIGLEYTNRFIKMKDALIYTTNKDSDEPQEENSSNILDGVVSKITSHYKDDYSKYNGFKQLFFSKENIDQIVKLIEDAVNEQILTNSFNNSIFEKFDRMIDDSQL